MTMLRTYDVTPFSWAPLYRRINLPVWISKIYRHCRQPKINVLWCFLLHHHLINTCYCYQYTKIIIPSYETGIVSIRIIILNAEEYLLLILQAHLVSACINVPNLHTHFHSEKIYFNESIKGTCCQILVIDGKNEPTNTVAPLEIVATRG